MSETALYRKYRPQSFGEIAGQDHIVKALKGSIDRGAISHAYLFSGSRGIGKTSIARIFAREIGTSANDLYEIDAASNRGIDDIRQIRESVLSLPFDSKYKVYIVDEVHMLTKEAFNALLKTLEEPPAHVVFILATTEMGKLPETVISRCQVFQFAKPNQETLKKLVEDVAKKEKCSVDPSSAELIALLGDGSFRDTLGTLQKVMGSVGGKKITIDDVEEVTGAPRGELVNEIVAAIAERKLEEGLAAVAKAAQSNVDMKTFLKLILQKARYALLLRFAPRLADTIKSELSEEDFKFVSSLANHSSANLNSMVLTVLLDAYVATGASHLSELPLELALVKLLGDENRES